jgi:hypothetical protein
VKITAPWDHSGHPGDGHALWHVFCTMISAP